MNFIEAFEIVGKYSNAIACNKGSSTFIRYSAVGETTDRIYDAFIIIIGHAVAFNNILTEKMKNYLFISQFIQNIVYDNTYEKAEKSMNIITNANSFDKIFRKKEIENAKCTFELCMNIISNRYETFHNSNNVIDFNIFLSELIDMKKYYVNNQDKMEFNDFFNDYIAKVYSYTTQKYYNDVDYILFAPFRVLKDKMLSSTGDDKKIFEKYKNIILENSK